MMPHTLQRGSDANCNHITQIELGYALVGDDHALERCSDPYTTGYAPFTKFFPHALVKP